MQDAWVLNQEILINPELYHPSEPTLSTDQIFTRPPDNLKWNSLLFR